MADASVNNPNPVDPSVQSSSYQMMLDYWQTAHDLLKGARAVRAGGERYLPRFDEETAAEYRKRCKFARYTNVYGDIVDSLSAKPFSEEVKILDGSGQMEQLSEDIDGQGNNLHNFAATYFKNALNYAVDWIFVDYAKVSPTVIDTNGNQRRRSVTDARRSGARPYWVRVPALDMIAVYSATMEGREFFVHARMRETIVVREADYTEGTIEQIRELNRPPLYNDDNELVGYGPAEFIIWQKRTTKVGRKVSVQWEQVDSGPITIGEIALVPLIIGDREDVNSWVIKAAMEDCADLQIDLYQQETGLQYARNMTSYPMLTGNGIEPVIDPKTKKPIKMQMGPRTVLYAPPVPGSTNSSSWAFIEISASSLKFLAEEVESTTKELRELGKQPLTANSGNLTVVTTAFAAQKGNSAIQRWSLALKDALEQACVYTAMWLNEADEATVYVKSDYDSDIMGHEDFTEVVSMRKEGDLSQETLWDEAQRRRILSDEFDPEAEKKALEKEAEEGPSFADMQAAMLGGNPPPGQQPGEEDEDVDPPTLPGQEEETDEDEDEE